MGKKNGRRYNPTNPQNYPKVHGRKPPAPRPHSSSGSMCRLGENVLAAVLLLFAAALVWGALP
jgi:hypothetical protein